MKKLIIAATLGATMLTAAPLSAQTYEQRRDYREAQRDYRQDVRQNRQDQREYRRALRDWRQARRYDYNPASAAIMPTAIIATAAITVRIA